MKVNWNWKVVLGVLLVLAVVAAFEGTRQPAPQPEPRNVKGAVLEEVERLQGDMVSALARICRIPAISPHVGGMGEEAKVQEIEKLITELGLNKTPNAVTWQRVDDPVSPTGNRPSLLLEWPGKQKRRLCILSHTDVVPEGDRSLWSVDPFDPVVKGTRLYGPGVTDDGVAIISSLYALKALLNAGVEPEYTICLAFAADEEEGSTFGLKALIDRDLFRSDDLVLVPDDGNATGSFIEVAEKGMWQPTFTVIGKQAHGSMPDSGLNACRVANLLSQELDAALHEAFPDEDPRFDPPASTFEPTRRLANVPSINIIPGKEVLNFDCRLLPSVSMDKVIEVAEKVMHEIRESTGAEIEMTVQSEEAAPPTLEDSEVVKLLSGAIRNVLNVEPKAGGIGGGTFAALFRKKGIPAAVWLQCDSEMDHQPDECVEIEYIVNNAKVFALMMLGDAQ